MKKNGALQEIPTRTVHAHDTIHPAAPVLLLFHVFVVFVTISCFFPFFLVIAFGFVFFW